MRDNWREILSTLWDLFWLIAGVIAVGSATGLKAYEFFTQSGGGHVDPLGVFP